MPDRVGESRSEDIKLFEGKKQSNQWVKENVEEHLNLQSQISNLHDLNTYLLARQADLLQGLKRTSSSKESFAQLPEKPTAENVAHTALFNTLQTQVSVELQYLQKMVQILKEGSPKNATLDTIEGQIQSAAKSFPYLSSEQLQKLTQAEEAMQNEVKNTPYPQNQKFWNTELAMLEQLALHTKGDSQAFHSELNEIKGRNQTITSFNGQVEQVLAALKKGDLSSTQTLQLVENLQNIANQRPLLSENSAAKYQQLLQELSKLKASNGTTLSDHAAAVLIQREISKKPNATDQEKLAQIKTFLTESHLQGSTLPFMKELGQSLANFTGSHALQSSFEFKLDQKNASAPIAAATALLGANEKEKEENLLRQGGYGRVVAVVGDIQHQIENASMWAASQSLLTGPAIGAKGSLSKTQSTATDDNKNIQNQFANFINTFWTKEEAYMLELALALEFSNDAATLGNKLLGNLVNVNSSDFNFNSWLGPENSSGQFNSSSGHTAADANAQIAAELKKLKEALAALDTTLGDVNAEIKKLEGPPLPLSTTPQGAELAKLQNMKTDITNAEDKMKTLQNMLSNMTAVPVTPPTPPTNFSIQFKQGYPIPLNWKTSLGNLESDVGTGVSTVKGDCENFITSYSSQGQQQQMQMQLEITEMQQKMSIVTSCLRTLNQAFMQAIQGISPR